MFSKSINLLNHDTAHSMLRYRAHWGRIKAYQGMGNICAASADVTQILSAAKLPYDVEPGALRDIQRKIKTCTQTNTNPESSSASDAELPSRPEPQPDDHAEPGSEESMPTGEEDKPINEENEPAENVDEPIHEVGEPIHEAEPEPEPEPELETLRLWGFGAAGLSGLSFILMTGMLGGGARLEQKFQDLGTDREEVRRRGYHLNRTAVAFGVIGGLSLTTGALLLALNKMRSRREDRLITSASLSRQFTGLLITLRF